MANLHELERSMPVAPLGIIALDSMAGMGRQVDQYMAQFRHSTDSLFQNDLSFEGYIKDSYLIKYEIPRFSTGEAKCVIHDSIRGKDLYIMIDICNHSLTYQMNGYTNHMSPDDHFQDLKRVISACEGHAARINVIMPFLYEGRQHHRTGTESLDCAYALSEIHEMGVDNIITFDAHDPRVQNSIPMGGFDNHMPTLQFIQALTSAVDDLALDKDHTIVISPDAGALDRAIYFAGAMGADTGMFYKRRDYSVIVNGKNPIVAHEFLGSDIHGKDIIIVDDMISSGESMLDTSAQLKAMGAKRVFICCTFGLFTNGLAAFDRAYESQNFDKVIVTNLTYLPPEIYQRPWFLCADMSRQIATIIDLLNHSSSISGELEPWDKIHDLLIGYYASRKVEE
ncbi:MAG: ribose-phosphate pyrophosphokinase [Lachnospiraceae bacterium]|nr:ribose-phosphate pyrophosphokinase [Lachnospiraceae bacterium]